MTTGSPKYRPVPTREFDLESCGAEEEPVNKPSIILEIISHILTLLSYTVFVTLLPITYWVCVLKLKQTDRIVIFRLGKLIGSRGPGRVLVFPWIDRVQQVDVSNSAFSVPPQQLITNDGGIVEIGAEVQFAITDCVALVREVADHQDILRSLGKTVMTRLLVKRTVPQLNKDKKICSQEIVKELNDQVRKWGLDIRCVSLSEVKVLKSPQMGGAGITPLLDSMGIKHQANNQFPSPMEFARSVYTGEGKEASPKGNPDFLSLVQEAEQSGKGFLSCLQTLLDEGEGIEPEAWGKYAIEISDENSVYYLTLNGEKKSVKKSPLKPKQEGGEPQGEEEALGGNDILITMTSSDFAGVLKGSLPPLQAYLTGRIQTKGDVRKLMFFDKISNRAHKPGQTFNL